MSKLNYNRFVAQKISIPTVSEGLHPSIHHHPYPPPGSYTGVWGELGLPVLDLCFPLGRRAIKLMVKAACKAKSSIAGAKPSP